MISVIIPVHNSGKTFERCIESVVHQTYTNLEILCIENGSSDNSWLLIQKYEKIDDRVKGYKLINVSSVSQARTKGLSEAQGEYITFLDSDDWFELNYLETMLTSMEESGSDLIATRWIIYPSMKISENGVGLITNDNKKFWDYALMNMVWGKLYKTSIVKHLRFDDVKVGEDAIFILKTIMQCSSIQFIPIAGYYYLKNEGSVTSKLVTSPEYLRELFRYPKIGMDYLNNGNALRDAINAWTDRCYTTIFYWSKKINSNEIWDLWENEMAELIRVMPPNSYFYKLLKIASFKIKNPKLIWLDYENKTFIKRQINRTLNCFQLQ